MVLHLSEESAYIYLKGLIRNPLFWVIVIGLTVRFILAPFTYQQFDFVHWAATSYGIQNGMGLYGAYAFWYPPVWGYVLGTMTFFADLLNIFPFDITFTNISTDELTLGRGTITTPLYSLFIKAPLIAADIVVGWLLYRIVMDMTSDKRKAAITFALWFLCPITIWVSSIHGQLEGFALMFMVLSLFLLMKDHRFMAGVMLSIATLTKVFPGLLFPIFCGYILSEIRSKKTSSAGILEFLAGAAISGMILIIFPVISGEGTGIINFFTGRLEHWDDDVSRFIFNMNIIQVAPIIIIISFVASVLLFFENEKRKIRLIECSAIAICSIYIWPYVSLPSQYLLMALPLLFLIYAITEKLLYPTLVLILAGFIELICVTGTSIFYPLGAYTNLADLQTLVDINNNITPLLRDIDVLLQYGISFISICILCLILLYIWFSSRRDHDEE